MPLTLQLVNERTLPDGGPVSIHVSGKRGIDIGRAAHLDWTLPDPTRFVSSKHCEVRYKDGGYWLHDVSTNGTILNGAAHRMSRPHRLRNGDRFTVGHYIVAATVEGEEKSAEPSPQNAGAIAARPLNEQEMWASQEAVPPPIDPKQLRPSAQKAPVHSDFLDWATDVPNPFNAVAPSSRAAVPQAPISPEMSWAEGAPSHVPTPPPAPPPTPAPRRPEWGPQEAESWNDLSQAAANRSASPAVPASRVAAPASSPPGLAAVAPEAFMRQLARAAGLPEEVLAQKDPGEVAQQIGTALRLVTENLMQLLEARREGKRVARSANHTTIQAVDNNPLKFSPSVADALRIMFGPPTTSYLDANRAIGQGFADLKAHQLKTYSAMQHAIATLMADFDPQTIEQHSGDDRGIAALLVSRKAKLWDAYVAQWDATIGRHSGGPIGAFMAHFTAAYDRDGG